MASLKKSVFCFRKQSSKDLQFLNERYFRHRILLKNFKLLILIDY